VFQPLGSDLLEKSYGVIQNGHGRHFWRKIEYRRIFVCQNEKMSHFARDWTRERGFSSSSLKISSLSCSESRGKLLRSWVVAAHKMPTVSAT
jgi:hypothetical protein